MQSCDLCGRPGAHLRARVAGTEAVVCDNCASMGEVIEEAREPTPKEVQKIVKEKKRREERTEEVVEDIGELVRKKREELGLKQGDLAKKISEHESMIKRIEHGYVPSVKIAQKLGRLLDLTLTEFINPSEQEYTSSKGGGALTLGDIMIVRSKKVE